MWIGTYLFIKQVFSEVDLSWTDHLMIEKLTFFVFRKYAQLSRAEFHLLNGQGFWNSILFLVDMYGKAIINEYSMRLARIS